jgi:stage IV sporulation protein FB
MNCIISEKISIYKTGKTNISVDPMALLLLPLLLLTVRYRLVSYYFLDLDSSNLWTATALISFAILICVVAHEAFHLTVSMARGNKSKGLFLGIFGDEEPIEHAPKTRRERIIVNLSGLFFSAILAFSFLGASYFFDVAAKAMLLSQICFHLALLNFALIALQLLPILPLDGGRLVLEFFLRKGMVSTEGVRALYWIGNTLAIAMMAMGTYVFLKDFVYLGVWFLVIGLSLLKANWSEYRFLKSRH